MSKSSLCWLRTSAYLARFMLHWKAGKGGYEELMVACFRDAGWDTCQQSEESREIMESNKITRKAASRIRAGASPSMAMGSVLPLPITIRMNWNK